MALRRSRTVALVVALATLTSNILSSLLFAQLPDDPYHLAANFGWYLHFANILSVFGFIGAVREHALSIAIFANYLILDTILCSIPRFLLLSLLRPLSSTLCSATFSQSQSQTETQSPSPSPQLQTWTNYTTTWTPDGCLKIVWLAQIALVASVLAATLLQFVGALCVRAYARGLWVREMREEEWARAVSEGRVSVSECRLSGDGRRLSSIEEFADLEREEEEGEKDLLL